MSRLERISSASGQLESRHSTCHPTRSVPLIEVGCPSTAEYGLQQHMGERDYVRPSPLRNGGDRLTLKMDVSFSDHSFIIGRGGKGIQGVMRETGCHIHFPDSNRNHRSEKSNQVSVAGPPGGVVAARQRIREHLPISFAFMVDKVDYRRAVTHPDSISTARLEPKPKVRHMIEALQNEFRMTITWLPMENLSCAMVTVRGRQSNFERIREGLRRLTSFLRPGLPPPPVHLGIEVSPHHLSFVVGAGDVKINSLMRATRTEFIIPPIRSDSSHHIPTVRIFGEVDNVYNAWLAFMDLLPVVLHIDIPDAVGFWRGRSGEYRDCSGDYGHGRCMEASDEAGKASNWLSSGSAVDCRQGYNHRQHPVTLEQLQELREFGFVSPEALTAVVAAAELDGDIGVLNPVFRSLVTLTDQLNSMLHGYEISLILRLGRDSRHWKMVAKGPEKHVDLLIDVYRAIRDSNHDPIALIRNALLTTPPPTSRFSLNSHKFTLHSPSMMSISSSASTRGISSEDVRRNTSAIGSSRCTPPGSRQNLSHYDFGCVPCEMLGAQETCEMFAKLLKINRELSNESPAFGHYAIASPSGSIGDDSQRRPFMNSSVCNNNNNNNGPQFSSTPRNHLTEPADQHFPGRYTTSGSCGGSSSGLHHVGLNGSFVGSDCGYYSPTTSEYSPWNGATSFGSSTTTGNESSASRALRYSYGDLPGCPSLGSPSSCLPSSHHENVGGARPRTKGDNICTPVRQGCGGLFDGFPLDGRGDCASVKEFDAAPGAGRDHRYV